MNIHQTKSYPEIIVSSQDPWDFFAPTPPHIAGTITSTERKEKNWMHVTHTIVTQYCGNK